MFSFYGSKSKIVKYYPSPLYSDLTEYFSGKAAYALEYFDRNVTLVDIDPIITGVWKYLIQATPQMVLSLPDVPNATKLETIHGFTQLAQEEKWLIGFCSNGGSSQPKNVSGRHNFNSWNKDKLRIAKNLHKIRHWKIINGSYADIPNKLGTHFIDPPYMEQGKWYKYHDIDYAHLGQWCKERFGQVIACENEGADWLPFHRLREVPFTHFKTEEDKKKKTIEVIWTKEDVDV